MCLGVSCIEIGHQLKWNFSTKSIGCLDWMDNWCRESSFGVECIWIDGPVPWKPHDRLRISFSIEQIDRLIRRPSPGLKGVVGLVVGSGKCVFNRISLSRGHPMDDEPRRKQRLPCAVLEPHKSIDGEISIRVVTWNPSVCGTALQEVDSMGAWIFDSK